MGLKFYKMTGLGNDFVFIDNMSGDKNLNPSALAKKICRRRLSIGADGLVILNPDPEVDFAWQFYNSDGSEAEMCGNAARCAARLSYLLGYAKTDLSFRTIAGIINAEIKEQTVKVEMIRPHSLESKIDLNLDDKSFDAGFVNTGVPHTVIFCEDLSEINLEDTGRKIRYSDMFAPAGTNVMFARVIDRNTMKIRSYERGVEAETMACGTGCTAAAIVGAARKYVDSPVKVLVASGDGLDIHFGPNPKLEDPWPQPVFMEGRADLVYSGEYAGEVK